MKILIGALVIMFVIVIAEIINAPSMPDDYDK